MEDLYYIRTYAYRHHPACAGRLDRMIQIMIKDWIPDQVGNDNIEYTLMRKY